MRLVGHGFLLIDEVRQTLDDFAAFIQFNRPIRHGHGLEELRVPVDGVYFQGGVEILVGGHAEDAEFIDAAAIFRETDAGS